MDGFHDFDREMEAQSALRTYFRRTTRYYVLKAWWEAQRTLTRANTHQQRYEAIKSIKRMRELYGDILDEALPLWSRSLDYRNQVRQIQKTRRMKPGEMEKLWLDTVQLG